MDADIQARLKALPQVNSLLEIPALRELIEKYSQPLIKHLCQQTLERHRQAILSESEIFPNNEEIITDISTRLKALLEPRLHRVINGTGILLHTGLGRAPLLGEAYQRAFQQARGFCNLELDLETGQRGDRQELLADLLKNPLDRTFQRRSEQQCRRSHVGVEYSVESKGDHCFPGADDRNRRGI